MKTWRVVWRKKSNRYDREIFYCTANDETHAWERCCAYIAREFQVRKPVFIEVSQMS